MPYADTLRRISPYADWVYEFNSIDYVLLFITTYGHIISVFFTQLYVLKIWVFFTRGYPFTLSGEGYGKKLYPLTGMGTGDG